MLGKGIGQGHWSGLRPASVQDPVDIVLARGYGQMPVVPISRASVATYYDANGLLITVPANTARYDFSTGSRVLLTEAAATNLLSQASASLANGWTKNGCDAVDLNLNALAYFKGVSITSKGAIWHRLACPNEPTVTNGATYHLSVFFKFGTSGKIMISLRNNALSIENRFEVTGSTVSLLSGAFTNIAVTQIGTAGVYRLDCDFVPTYSGAVNVGIGPSGASTGLDMILLGAQLEAGGARSSFINSAGSPMTRPADVVSVNLDAGSYIVTTTTSVGTTVTELTHVGGTYTPTFTGKLQRLNIAEA